MLNYVGISSASQKSNVKEIIVTKP